MRLEVYLNARGERRFVGLLEERGGDILFEYDKRFLDSGIELSPFLLPLRPGGASDPKRTFDGLGAAPAGPPAAAQRPAAGTDHAPVPALAGGERRHGRAGI